ncbi:YegP family protein [Chitinophaga rhizosphaerae]|uniref:YegP family protein n=1 Tax=Chitinophaga rhizosphaerae TaxID=1864947 RepID=UPI000F802146|nr:YegP family protein [Chitinophaga rhizosphaerae]
MSKFVITKRSNGEFQFNLKAGNGEVILTSEGYSSKAACQNGIDSVRNNARQDERFERKSNAGGKFYFNLKAANGQIIGTSQQYSSETTRDGGIDSVKKNAPEGEVDDQSAA